MKLSLSLYWKCQLIGWGLASLYWLLLALMGAGFHWGLGIAQFLLDVTLYIGITHAYRNFAKKRNWTDISLGSLGSKMAGVLPSMALIYTVGTIFKVYYIRHLFFPEPSEDLMAFIRLNGITVLAAGFRLMAIWLLAYHLYHYARREIRLRVMNSELQTENLTAQLSNLSSQLNPHFLFNSLNAIKSLVFKSPESAARGLDLLSELLRNGLYQNERMMIPFEKELSLVEDYLELQKLRFEENLSYVYEIDPSLNNFPVPRMSLQALVENAIKHGISNRVKGGELKIKVSKEKGRVSIEVWSPKSQILDDQIRFGIGLSNLEKRLALAYGNQAEYELIERPNDICASIKIPFSHEQE
ncbi:histidine kinase [Marinilongibacter aquaticus]|uniref:sensor histidine kinase n=1 Tax=Marinilongibacter aquaticus TaxID=2975157 RepID=UPI0021BD09F9|nr:histidine kinase [Marinilongibacter aquaticus]UBM58787.1 histidine kinase [Marinilongibacter aquaticus]